MRNESQIPREKWGELKSGEGKTENPALRRSGLSLLRNPTETLTTHAG